MTKKKEKKLRNKTNKIRIIIVAILLGCLILGIGGILFMNYSRQKTYNEKISLGDKYLEKMDYENAILAYSDAINIYPKKSQGYISLSEVYVKNGDYENAKVVLSSAPVSSMKAEEKIKIEEKTELVQKLEEEAKKIEEGVYQYENGEHLSWFSLYKDSDVKKVELMFWHNYGDSSSDEDFYFEWVDGQLEYEVRGNRSQKMFNISFVKNDENTIKIEIVCQEEYWDWESIQSSDIWSNAEYEKLDQVPEKNENADDFAFFLGKEESVLTQQFPDLIQTKYTESVVYQNDIVLFEVIEERISCVFLQGSSTYSVEGVTIGMSLSDAEMKLLNRGWTKVELDSYSRSRWTTINGSIIELKYNDSSLVTSVNYSIPLAARLPSENNQEAREAYKEFLDLESNKGHVYAICNGGIDGEPILLLARDLDEKRSTGNGDIEKQPRNLLMYTYSNGQVISIGPLDGRAYTIWGFDQRNIGGMFVRMDNLEWITTGALIIQGRNTVIEPRYNITRQDIQFLTND